MLMKSNKQTDTPDTYQQAIRNLNEAAYAAIRACRDTTKYPDINRHDLHEIARTTDRLLDEHEEPTT